MRAPDVSPRPLFSRIDAFELMALAVLAPVAWILPERAWGRIGHALSVGIARAWPAITRDRIATLGRALGGRGTGRNLDGLRVAIIDGYMEERLAILREHRPGGWNPRIRLSGREYLDRALTDARGAVLWAAPFSYADLVIKMALREAGVAVSHLSAFSRGFSPNSCYAWNPSRFGQKVLSPLRTKIEDRYLRERIVLAPDGSLAWTRTAERRLRANGVVSLRAGDTGHRALEVPFLEGRIRLATGAPSLALMTGAALLPVFSVRDADAAFAVVIEPPLTLVPAPATTRHDAVDALTDRYARVLERYVVAHPELWSGWYSMRLDGATTLDRTQAVAPANTATSASAGALARRTDAA